MLKGDGGLIGVGWVGKRELRTSSRQQDWHLCDLYPPWAVIHFTEALCDDDGCEAVLVRVRRNRI